MMYIYEWNSSPTIYAIRIIIIVHTVCPRQIIQKNHVNTRYCIIILGSKFKRVNQPPCFWLNNDGGNASRNNYFTMHFFLNVRQSHYIIISYSICVELGKTNNLLSNTTNSSTFFHLANVALSARKVGL